jgi:para-nitrobenzyl esterase
MLRLGAIIFGAVALASAAQAQAPKVKVEGGVLVGASTDRADIFRNVPYAAPPVGDLRWAPPQASGSLERRARRHQQWPVLPAEDERGRHAQRGQRQWPGQRGLPAAQRLAPKNAKSAPVMVWLHGGSHRTGAGWIYDGQNFARDGVVLVAINYRLGPLGYFAHPALTKAAGEAPMGNYGLMDQVAALEWVQRNIAAFGGDPKNVTVFGESAGGASTLAILSTPAAKGLFHKAAVQSGGGWSEPKLLTVKEAEGAAVATSLGLAGAQASLAELRAIPADRLIDETLAGEYGPFVDGRLLKETPAQAFAAGRETDAPLIIGANSGEDSLLGRKLSDPAAWPRRSRPTPARPTSRRPPRGTRRWCAPLSATATWSRPHGGLPARPRKGRLPGSTISPMWVRASGLSG